uniref:Disease resistance RPP13-like protein 1 n=1 Tax=Cajanus cajan TaxID=3821 RepID=A0A151RRX3_CAJCA|nr:Putative disease resistance RPP13-like protein 1 [Cajanus cajan]
MALAVVGGAFLSAFINVLFDKLASPEVVNFIRGKNPGKLLQAVNNKLLLVSHVFEDAEKRQITDPNVKKWLNVLKDLVYEVDDLLDEVSTKAATQKKVNKHFSPFINRKKIVSTSKLEDIVERLDDLLKQKLSLDLKEIPVEIEQWKAQPTSLEDGYGIYGREKDKEAIIKLLLEDNVHDEHVSVIPIVGMGGVGKTTLARSVYNDGNLNKEFDLHAWVCVSDKFDIVKVTKTLIEQVTHESCRLNDLDSLQLELMDKLKDKKFLIVLDDVWIKSNDNWRSLKKPFLSGIKGSKILMTTRNKNVVEKTSFHIVGVYPLDKLSNENCWLVFANHAFPPSESNENRSALEKIGREIVKKCDGLPLAAQSLGGMLRRKHAIRDWNNILHSDIWKLPENHCEIIPALRISYHYLPSHLKRCFVYCSLYPKDYIFKKNELILLWMAEDLLKAPENGKTLEEVGSEYFDDLVSTSFFQHYSSYNTFVMHDLMHDLTISLGGEFYSRSEELGKETKIDVKTRHLSFTKFSDPVTEHFQAFGSVKFLRTFLPVYLEDSPFNNEKATYIISSKLPYLRVLSFRGFDSLHVLPNSIGELIHLRYLNLSETRIQTLPESVCNLFNLQTLKLNCCFQLTKLPSDMQNLVNLRHLDIRGTHIEEMPRGIGKLNHLQQLHFFPVGKHKENSIKELGGLSNLHGWLLIKNLENVTNCNEALGAKIADKKQIDSLKLEWSSSNNGVDFQIELDVLCKLQPHEDLKWLSIRCYKGNKFPDWVGNFSYHKLTFLMLIDCDNCCMLPSLGELPSLEHLEISRMKSVKTIDAGFYKNNDCSLATPFPSLKFLVFSSMSCWEVWSSFESNSFPVLQELTIRYCPKLSGDLPKHLPALKTLDIDYCELLVSSLPRAPSLHKLRINKSNKVALNVLETLDCKGLLHLTSLQQLEIDHCQKLKNMAGERLPVSLIKLSIMKCPLLQKQCCKKHPQIWSKIFHIRGIKVDHRWIL